MAMEVSVGPKIPTGNPGEVSAVVICSDPAHHGGPAIHVKIVMRDVRGEEDAVYLERAANEAKHLVDMMSTEIGLRAYRARTEFRPPMDDEEGLPGG